VHTYTRKVQCHFLLSDCSEVDEARGYGHKSLRPLLVHLVLVKVVNVNRLALIVGAAPRPIYGPSLEYLSYTGALFNQ